GKLAAVAGGGFRLSGLPQGTGLKPGRSLVAAQPGLIVAGHADGVRILDVGVDPFVHLWVERHTNLVLRSFWFVGAVGCACAQAGRGRQQQQHTGASTT
ncbi:MAG: hypothetical protein AAGG08_14765, partial [Actinomycetota bacterium]